MRQAMGIAKYGTTVRENPLDLRQWLQHAYEECLDQAVYLRRAIEEIDNETTRTRPTELQRMEPTELNVLLHGSVHTDARTGRRVGTGEAEYKSRLGHDPKTY
jgi:hypothetical protein